MWDCNTCEEEKKKEKFKQYRVGEKGRKRCYGNVRESTSRKQNWALEVIFLFSLDCFMLSLYQSTDFAHSFLFYLLPWLVASVPFSSAPVPVNRTVFGTGQIRVSCNFREVGGVVPCTSKVGVIVLNGCIVLQLTLL